ncbi:hypothetical protein LUZ60_004487 [Juncus effusus]|nr:hypothetical protein LUZ60_004487 [Juncus effusus]
MAFESDSDSGSYISATPPRPSSPPSPSVKSRPKPKPDRETGASSSRSRSKERLRSSKGKNDGNIKHKPEYKPKDKHESEVQKDSDLDRLLKSDPDNLLIRSCSVLSSLSSSSSFTSSFSRLVKSRRPSFDPDLEFKPETIDLKQVEESTCNHLNSKQTKRFHPNSIRVELPVFTAPELSKRPKIQNEGNFVRLNINGYGRKYNFKSGKRDNSAYNKYRKKRWTNYKKFKKGEGENDDLFGCDGLFDKQKENLKCNNEEIDRAVKAVRDDLTEENLRNLLKLSHGFELFREGQIDAIKRAVLGESTMLVLPTGAGKSLCYQIPALILPGVTLVVSPLIALMIDQLKKLPPVLPAGLLSSNQTGEESLETLNRLCSGEIKVLFVSPERFLNSEFLSIFSNGLSISLLVIDEAHCISEWSHNFRPSYLRLRASLLKRKLNINCILAMTATATNETLENIMNSLEISKSNLIQTSQIRENLQLSVSSSENRLKDLMLLMKSSPFVDMKSIIIYCKFQYETDMIGKYLCDNNVKAKGYHSGLPSKERSRIQDLFCSNKIRVIVATVAFGMGLDKSDVQGVIHYSMPESLEEYIQEIGRAGRDGRVSNCHLFLDTATYLKIRSLSYSDGVDEYAISKLLDQIFCSDNSTGDIHWLIKESTSRKFDIKEEVLLTVLTMLEIGEEQYLHLLPQINSTCSLHFHKTSPQLLADKDLLVRSILMQSEKKDGQYVFEIPTIANSLRIEATEVLDQLKDLKVQKFKIPFLHADIKAFLRSNSSMKFTPRAVARIMHGIPSPAFPSSSWARNHFWGRYMETDFQVVMEAAKTELVNSIKKSGE